MIEVNSNLEVRENAIKVVKGDPSTATPPTMTHANGVDQYRLADVTVPAAATSISAANVANKVGQDDTPFVTAPLKSVDISDLYTQWEGEFDEWFDNVQAQLTDNVVTNLQYQIDQKFGKDDVATEEDIKNGVPDKLVTSDLLKNGSYNILSDVGDIVFTERTNLGDDWLLCNGEYFNPADYPKLNQVLKMETMLSKGANMALHNNTSWAGPCSTMVVGGDYIVIPYQLSASSGIVGQSIYNIKTKTWNEVELGGVTIPSRWAVSNDGIYAVYVWTNYISGSTRYYLGLASAYRSPDTLSGNAFKTKSFDDNTTMLIGGGGNGVQYMTRIAIYKSYIICIARIHNGSWTLLRADKQDLDQYIIRNYTLESGYTSLDMCTNDDVAYLLEKSSEKIRVRTLELETLNEIGVAQYFTIQIANTIFNTAQYIDGKLIMIVNGDAGTINFMVLDLKSGVGKKTTHNLVGRPTYKPYSVFNNYSNYNDNSCDHLYHINGKYIFLPLINPQDTSSNNVYGSFSNGGMFYAVIDDIMVDGDAQTVDIIINSSNVSECSGYMASGYSLVNNSLYMGPFVITLNGYDATDPNPLKKYSGSLLQLPLPSLPLIKNDGQSYAYIKAK